MSVELYIGKEFDTTYEREALSRFIKSMGNRFGNKNELYIILANYVINGKFIDLTIIKRDAILVVELKECNEAFTAYSNKDWRTESGKLIGRNNGYNPRQQVDEYRNIWINFLKEHKRHFDCLKNVRNTSKPFCYTKSYVVIFPSLNNFYSNKITGENWWFRLCGLNDLDEKISYETNEILNFSNDEMRFIATELLSLDNPRVIQTTNTENMAEQIRKCAYELTSIIDENKKKISILEQNLYEKERVTTELQNTNKQLYDNLSQNLAVIEKIKNESHKREEAIQELDAMKFKLVVEYVVSNYLNNMSNKQAIILAKMAKKFSINEVDAMKIINELALKAKKKCL